VDVPDTHYFFYLLNPFRALKVQHVPRILRSEDKLVTLLEEA